LHQSLLQQPERKSFFVVRWFLPSNAHCLCPFAHTYWCLC
jgi:hypothetical protein